MFRSHGKQNGKIIGVIFCVQLCIVVIQSVVYYHSTVNDAACGPVESHQPFGATYYLHLQGRIVNMETTSSSETGIGSFLTDYIAPHPRRQ
jgi:hypothetical protein